MIEKFRKLKKAKQDSTRQLINLVREKCIYISSTVKEIDIGISLTSPMANCLQINTNGDIQIFDCNMDDSIEIYNSRDGLVCFSRKTLIEIIEQLNKFDDEYYKKLTSMLDSTNKAVKALKGETK